MARRNPRHPEAAQALQAERYNARKAPIGPNGWVLVFTMKDWSKRTVQITYVDGEDGSKRLATYKDAVRIRDERLSEMEDAQSCWLIMRTAQSAHKWKRE